MGMYAKLMARITESSLMEETIEARYCFMMLLAIADPTGCVIGTDIAIARRINVDLKTFQECIKKLMQPDVNSNSKEEDGRRIIESDGERGYQLVNYVKYRDTRDEDHRREYMKEYMRKRRGTNAVAPVNSGKQCKPPLAQVEVEVKEPVKVKAEEPPNPQGGKKGFEKTGVFIRIESLFGRRLLTEPSDGEIKAFKKIGQIDLDDLALIEAYYRATLPKNEIDYRRRDLQTLLNNWKGEVDRARKFQPPPERNGGF